MIPTRTIKKAEPVAEAALPRHPVPHRGASPVDVAEELKLKLKLKLKRRTEEKAEAAVEVGGAETRASLQECLTEILTIALKSVSSGLSGEMCSTPAAPTWSCTPSIGTAMRRRGTNKTRRRHCTSLPEFLQLLSQQLTCTLDYGITSLDVTGARGALFKVTLLEHGYTFISKGTVEAFIPDLEHEARAYRRLERVQGLHVPVFLGAIDLRPPQEDVFLRLPRGHRASVLHVLGVVSA